MIMNEQDPEFVRWSHQLFDTDPYSNCAYYGIVSQDHIDYYQGDYTKEDYYGVESDNVNQDELLAQALQDELSQLAVTEAPGTPPTCSEQLQASFFSQNWDGQPIGCNYGSGQEEPEDVLYSSSCSSPEEKSYYGDECSYTLEMVDDSYDSEVGKRLNQMISIPHVPKINGEIPSLDEATLDHQRLLERLQVYDLVECKVQGDGNCQFRALSDQFYRTSEHHEFVRQEIVSQLKSFRETYEGYVPMEYDDYLEKMSRSGEWGDHVTLQAAADLYGVKIFVITSFKDTCYIEILPSDQRSERVIFLSFWAEVHYNSIYPEGDASAFKVKKKKKRRMFWNKHLTTTREYS